MFCRPAVAPRLVLVSTSVLLAAFFMPTSVTHAQSANAATVACGGKMLLGDANIRFVVQLADDEFSNRKLAEQALELNGVQAWDVLTVATASNNHEIASVTRRLVKKVDFVSQLHYLKTHPVLDGYREMSFADRARVIIRLSRSFRPEEQIILAELVRFEEDSFLSNCAAVELITGGRHDRQAVGRVVRCNHREASEWLRIDARASRDGVSAWTSMIDGFFASQDKAISQDDATFQHDAISQAKRRLTKWYVQQCLDEGNDSEAERVAQLLSKRLPAEASVYLEVMDWCLLHRFHDVARGLLQRAENVFGEVDTNLCWRAAELSLRLGDQAGYEKHLTTAIASCNETPSELLQHGVILQSVGLDRMAHQSLNALVINQDADEMVRIHATLMLAEMHFNSNDLQSAIDVIEQISADDEDSGFATVGSSTDSLYAKMKSRKAFFCYLQAIKLGDWKKATALTIDCVDEPSLSTDWMIALSSIPREVLALSDITPQQMKKNVDGVIQAALASRQKRIVELRNQFDPDPKRDRVRKVELANELNSFAWLASQTGTQLAEAEEAAREANQLHPGSGKMLDTLAACLHERGKWTEAIAVQQRAMIRSPYSVSMKQKLAEYQRAWATAQLPSVNAFR